MKIGARTFPNSTHTPATLVCSWPFTKVPAWAVPGGAKLLPKIVTMAPGERTFTAGTLKPALTIPFIVIAGALEAAAVMENVKLGSA